MSPSSPSPRSRTAPRILAIVIAVVVLGGVGILLGQSFIPLPTATGCTVADVTQDDGGRSGEVTRVASSCGEHFTQLPVSSFEIGETYDFSLRGLFNTNITAATPS